MAFLKMCQGCGSRGKDVSRREIRAKEFVGPCSDSFCYTTCESASCRALECILCSDCAVKLETVGFSSLARSARVAAEGEPKAKASSRRKGGVRAFFQKIEYHGKGADEVSLIFIASIGDYEDGRSIGNFLCSNVRLGIEVED